MAKIIYIAGLGHSGSTILDMSLATLPDVIGLGELKTLLDEKSRNRHFSSLCSCGKTASACDFWGAFNSIEDDVKSIDEKYEWLINYFKAKFGENAILVDSSKNIYDYINYLKAKHDIYIIYLSRDVRSWSASRSFSTGKPILYYFFRWYLENKKLLFQLKKMKIKFFRAGYEELALFPDKVFGELCSFLNLPFKDSLLHPEQTKSHIISGNIARIDQQKRVRWTYDARWLLSTKIYLYSPLLLFFGKMNNRLVYSNISGSRISDFYLFGAARKKALSKKYN